MWVVSRRNARHRHRDFCRVLSFLRDRSLSPLCCSSLLGSFAIQLQWTVTVNCDRNRDSLLGPRSMFDWCLINWLDSRSHESWTCKPPANYIRCHFLWWAVSHLSRVSRWGFGGSMSWIQINDSPSKLLWKGHLASGSISELFPISRWDYE